MVNSSWSEHRVRGLCLHCFLFQLPESPTAGWAAVVPWAWGWSPCQWMNNSTDYSELQIRRMWIPEDSLWSQSLFFVPTSSIPKVSHFALPHRRPRSNGIRQPWTKSSELWAKYPFTSLAYFSQGFLSLSWKANMHSQYIHTYVCMLLHMYISHSTVHSILPVYTRNQSQDAIKWKKLWKSLT